jgi:hypothetical protein
MIFSRLQRNKTLMLVMGVFLGLAFLGALSLYDWGDAPSKTPKGLAPLVTNDEASSSAYLSQFGRDGDNLILSLNDGSASKSYFSRRGVTKNLLFVSANADSTRWLFPEHHQTLSEIVFVGGSNNAPRAIFVEFKSKMNGSSNTDQDQLNMLLVHPDGTNPTVIASGMDQTVGSLVRKDELQVAYRKNNALRVVRVSLRDFSIRSDRALLNLETLERSALTHQNQRDHQN